MNDLQTPYERGNKNQTTTLAECIAWYEALAARFPDILHFSVVGTSDAGLPIHAGLITADGVFDRAQLKREGRPVFFNNNGIHPGEPEGVDSCMALVRDFCLEPARRAALGKTVFLFVPLYNVDGSINRANTSRVNQDGPEQFGFRGNARHLDLNRDFIKCDTLTAQVFNKLFTAWDPDVMVDTHTSNGADYPYTMTLIHTQADKLGGGLGDFLRDTMLPHMFADMAQRGWPTCPYVNPVKDSPDHGMRNSSKSPASRPASPRCTTPSASCPKRTCSSPSPTATRRCGRWSSARWTSRSPTRPPSRACAAPRAMRARPHVRGRSTGPWTRTSHRPSASRATRRSTARA